jgi:hypothetical protein
MQDGLIGRRTRTATSPPRRAGERRRAALAIAEMFFFRSMMRNDRNRAGYAI